MLNEETTMHLYQCQAPEMLKLLTEEIRDLEDALQRRHLPSDMWRAMEAGITHYRSRGEYSAYIPATPRADRAYCNQTLINWDQFLKGRLAKDWGLAMSDVYASDAGLNYTESRRRFSAVLISQLWSVYDKLWSLRCEKLHDDTNIHALSNMELDRRIRYFYANKTTLFDGGDFDRFHLGLEHTLSLDKSRKKGWIQTLDGSLKSTTKSRKTFLRHMKPLHHYFQPAQNSAED